MNKKSMLIISLFVGLAAVAIISCVSSPAEAVNLALGKTAVASSVESDTLGPENTIDGNKKSRWSTDWQNDENPDVGWIYVDLGSKTPIKTVQLTWEAAFGKVYNIQVSDDAENWNTVLEVSNGKEGKNTYEIPAGTEGRYVKIDGVQRGTSWGYSLFEFEVF
ncbi:MAG: discoidin domain-containing protein [Spirochaetales bacterium]|nr:discoidin domain-containing protein [Spirochaetales bacterium]